MTKTMRNRIKQIITRHRKLKAYQRLAWWQLMSAYYDHASAAIAITCDNAMRVRQQQIAQRLQWQLVLYRYLTCAVLNPPVVCIDGAVTIHARYFMFGWEARHDHRA